MRWESGIGRGSEDTVEVQKRFNRFDAQTVKFLESAATPAHTYVKGSVDRHHVKKIGFPNAIIPINQEVAQALGTTDLVRQIPVGNVSGNLFQYTYDILNQFRQLTSHVTDFTNAFPGVDNRTATGAQLAKNSADSIYSPFLQLKSEVRVSTAKNTLTLYNKHFQGVGKYFSYGESATGQHIGSQIKGEDIDVEIEFTVVRDSEQPKTMYDRQVDFVNMLNSAGQSGGYSELKATEPKLAQALLHAFDIDIDDNVYDLTTDVCEQRLEEANSIFDQFKTMQQVMPQITGRPVPAPPIEALLEGLSQPIIVEEPNHKLKASWYSDYLDTPQGMKLDAERREVVSLLVRTHYQMAVAQESAIAAGYAEVGSAAMAPEAAAAQAQLQAQAQIQEQQGASQHQRALELKELEAEQQLAQLGGQASLEQQRADNDKELAMINSALKVGEAKEMPKESAKNSTKTKSKKKAGGIGK
jgi:hypothetical protein